jgi:spoIIIJ-associated protein
LRTRAGLEYAGYMDNDVLKQLVEKLVELLEVETTSVTVNGTRRTVVEVTSPQGEKLIGENGETLRALNTVAKRLMEAKHGTAATTFILDVNNFQDAKLEGVRNNARQAAQRVRLFKNEAALDPMTAYERLVVHELFAEDPEIATESAGEGTLRHIVLTYKQK